MLGWVREDEDGFQRSVSICIHRKGVGEWGVVWMGGG